MGFFKKLFGTAAVTGAAVGGALYVKKRKDEKEMNKDLFEDFDDSKAFEIQKDDNTDGTIKVTLTINKRKVKNMADMAADKVIDASDKLKDTVSDKIGEEKIEAVKDKIDTAKEKVSDVADMAKEKFYDAKDVVVETVGEDKIDTAKEKVSEVANMAKDKVSETINKVTTPSNEKEEFEDDLFEEDIDDDFLEDELKDI